MAERSRQEDTKPQGEGGLARWSRRKAAARQADPAPQSSPHTTAASAPPQGEAAAGGPLADARAAGGGVARSLPAIDDLDQDSDYAAFLTPGVTAELRRGALRKLFHLPVFNVTDGLDDHCEDLTRLEPLGECVTHDMRRAALREAQRVLARAGGPALPNTPATAEDPEPADPPTAPAPRPPSSGTT